MLTPDDILERTQWDTYWVPPDLRIVDRPDVRALVGPPQSLLLNSVVRTRGDPARAVDFIQPLHRGVSRWLVLANTPRYLPRFLRQAGYAETMAATAYTLGTKAWKHRAPSAFRAEHVETASQLEEQITVMARAFGRSPEKTEPTDALLAACTGPNARTHRWLVRDAHGQPVSAGGLNLFTELSFGFLWAGGTVPEARGQGAYAALLDARIAFARRRGLAAVGLYANNATSAPIVAAFGFEPHGPMAYWDRVA